MYSTNNGRSADSITDYAIPVKCYKEEEVREPCKRYIFDNYSVKKFEEQRHEKIDNMIANALLDVLYERYIIINEDTFDYDEWGSEVYRLYPKGGRGAKKVLVLIYSGNSNVIVHTFISSIVLTIISLPLFIMASSD